jgi:PAS domain S-box-containing protein
MLLMTAGVAVLQTRSWTRTLALLHGQDRDLRSAGARYRLLAEAMSDLVALVDPESGEVLYASPSYQRTLGYQAPFLDALMLLFVTHPDDRAAGEALVRRAAEHGSARGLMRMRDAAGRFLTFEVAFDSVLHEERKVVALVARDVTAQRGLQDQLAQAQKMELVGRLSGGIAHDFNNLLTVSRSCAEFARDTLTADHPARRELDDLIDATARGAGLTRQLLALARKEAPDPDARCAVEKVLGDLQRLLPRVLGSTIRYEVHTELGLGSVVGQAVQIEQVILNLALNARDAMPSGGALTIRAFREVADDPDGPDRVALEVRDTGTGMVPEVAARMFEPFFTTKPVGVGNGLGLATSRTIVNQLGGDIRVWTELGKGTAFTVLLPAADAVQSAERSPPALAVVRTIG